MNIFKTFGRKLSYKDIMQLDGAFSVAHINYGKSPIFNKVNSKGFTENSRKNSVSCKDKIENLSEYLYAFNGTGQNVKIDDRVLLWENYWLEYINAFDNLIKSLPNSVVTVYVGRHAVEIGMKYLLLKKTNHIKNEHDLGILSDLLFTEYNIKDDYMEYINEFCEFFCKYIEGENSEYFRYPDYKKNTFFAGNNLDIEWILYNLSLIILKLIHFADLEAKFN